MFRYQQKSDTFLCPAGEVMKPRRLHSVRLSWEYVTKRGVCLACRLRQFCTRSKTGRSIKRIAIKTSWIGHVGKPIAKEPSSIANAGII